MIRARRLPLGVDLGRCRVRVALVERDGRDGCRLVAVAARDGGQDSSSALLDALNELGTVERRCVLGLGSPDAALRKVAFPPMSRLERRRAARFEATRLTGDDAAIVTLTPLPDDDGWVLGTANPDTVARRRAAAAAAGLRVVALDDVDLAIARAQPHVTGTIDISGEATRLTIFADPLPHVTRFPIGGQDFTAAIGDALGIDLGLAEARKRAHGFGGAGEARRDALIAEVVSAIGAAQAATGLAVRSLALIGNGARVPGLAEAFERAAGIPIRLAELDATLDSSLPADVLRAAGADWSLAVGLALWQAGA